MSINTHYNILNAADSILRRKFRKQYITLGIIRSFFSGVPIMTLSATSPPHVRKRVNYTLGMAQPTTLIERSVDRPNIYLSVEYVRSTLTSYLDLNYLIPKANKCERLQEYGILPHSRTYYCLLFSLYHMFIIFVISY